LNSGLPSRAASLRFSASIRAATGLVGISNNPEQDEPEDGRKSNFDDRSPNEISVAIVHDEVP
jgi:hypothetical protein